MSFREEMAAPAIKLYGLALSPNVVRAAAVLNEKGLDFEIVPVDLTTGAHKQPDFLALNVRQQFLSALTHLGGLALANFSSLHLSVHGGFLLVACSLLGRSPR